MFSLFQIQKRRGGHYSTRIIQRSCIGSVFDGVIDAIPKSEAEALLKTIYDGITSAKKEAQGETTTQQVSIADELKKLATLKEQGVISEEEFSKMKQDLINKSSS